MDSLSPAHVRVLALAILATALVLVALTSWEARASQQPPSGEEIAAALPTGGEGSPAREPLPAPAAEVEAAAGESGSQPGVLAADTGDGGAASAAGDGGSGSASGSGSGGAEGSAPGTGNGASVDAGPPPGAPAGCERERLLVSAASDLPITASPGSGPVIGTVPAYSIYLGGKVTVWVHRLAGGGRYGEVVVPWSADRSRGWIDLRGVERRTTSTVIVVDNSERRISAWQGCARVWTAPAAVGAPASPTPTGHYTITDPVPVPASQPQFGTYAFGMSGIQPNLPAGWTGGNQLAIHGTNAPSSIGQAVSAGCPRLTEPALQRMRELAGAGTPVIVQA